MKRIAVTTLLVCLPLFAACAGKRQAPAKLDTQADLWAEVENLKAQVGKINSELEEISYHLKAGLGGGNADARLDRLEGQLSQMASQLAIELETPAPGAVPATPTAAGTGAEQTGVSPFTAGRPATTPTSQQPPAATDSYLPTGPGAQTAPSTSTTYQSGQNTYIAPPAAAPTRDPADALYTTALQSFNAKQYDRALAEWKAFTQKHPGHMLTPNSLFWSGECYYQLGDYANAVLAYQDVIEKYPQSSKYPDALFKRGAALLKLGQKQAAKVSLQEVVKKYPDSTYARRARAMMPK